MGIPAALLSALLLSSKDLVSKRLASRVDGTVSAFASFAYALPYYTVVYLLFLALGRESLAISGYVWVLVLLRALTDTAAELLKMHALSRADLSLVVSIFALYPGFLLLASPLITGDPLTMIGVLAIFLIVSGSLLLVYRGRETFSHSTKLGILCALSSSFFFALNSCFDRLAVQHASPLFSGFAMTFLSGLFLLPLMYRKPDSFRTLPAHNVNFLIRGFFEVGFMVSKLYALQFLQAPYVVGIQKLSLLFSIFGGRLIFGEQDFWRRFVAGLLVLSGIAVILLFETAK